MEKTTPSNSTAWTLSFIANVPLLRTGSCKSSHASLTRRPYLLSEKTFRHRPEIPRNPTHEPAFTGMSAVDVFKQSIRPPTDVSQDETNAVVVVPGFGAPATNYYSMVNELRKLLHDSVYVSVVPVTVQTWLRTFGGRPVTPVLQLLDDEVQKACAQSKTSKVSLVAHSAGGWIARIYLGQVPYPSSGAARAWCGHRFVSKLVCLGTPHRSDEGVAKKNMQFVNENYPGAYHGHVEYVNMVGDGGSVAERGGGAWRFWDTDWLPRVSYRLTDKSIGNGAVAGDGTFSEALHSNLMSCTRISIPMSNYSLRFSSYLQVLCHCRWVSWRDQSITFA